MRTVCPIRYEWVKDLLPKLHEVDVYDLSNVAREEVTNEEMTKWEKREAAKRQSGFPKLLFIYKANKSCFFGVNQSNFKLCNETAFVVSIFPRNICRECHEETRKAKQ